jgi:hypothetical protein
MTITYDIVRNRRMFTDYEFFSKLSIKLVTSQFCSLSFINSFHYFKDSNSLYLIF